MNAAFYFSAAVAIFSTIMVITRTNAVHALLYMIVSLLAIAVIFFVMGAPFIAALEVIIYAGAIMVMFIFVMIMLNLGKTAVEQERQWLSSVSWAGPFALVAALCAEFVWVSSRIGASLPGTGVIGPEQVGITLFGPYLLGVELASMLLLSGLVGAFHLGRHALRGGNKGDDSGLDNQ
jgi:NADH-quinone oxidoreductase subunit J